MIVSLACEPDRARYVVASAETHPQAIRPIYDEQIRRCSVVLDLAHLHEYADRACERDVALEWLTHCRDQRVEMPWGDWMGRTR